MEALSDVEVFDLLKISSLDRHVSERASRLRRELTSRNRSGTFLRMLGTLSDTELLEMQAEHRAFLKRMQARRAG
jgi:hypothetical protein